MNKNFKQSTVADILAYFGKDVSYFRGGFFRSPFRDEDKPSFHVHSDGRVWYDHGSGESGGVKKLVSLLKSPADPRSVEDILREIEGLPPASVIEGVNKALAVSGDSRLEVSAPSEVTDSGLLEYAASRGIDAGVVRRHCDQVKVTVAGTGIRPTPYIGFRNSNGGYVLRNSNPKYGKRCTASFPTFIAPDGSRITEAASADGVTSWTAISDRVVVFEGFFNYLSYLQIGVATGVIRPPEYAPGCDVCVLNSVTNRSRALDFVLAHSDISLFLDNDPVGKETTQYFIDAAKSAAPSVKIVDCSSFYAGEDDLNDFIRKNGTVPI